MESNGAMQLELAPRPTVESNGPSGAKWPEGQLAAGHSGWVLGHFSRHSIFDLQNDCLQTCVGGTSDLCLGELSLLAFTASELRAMQSREHCGPADHWAHYRQHGPVLNVASLLYFLLLLPLDALCPSHRASLVWFVDMVLHHKCESVQALSSIALGSASTGVFVLDGAQHVPHPNYMGRVSRMQRPALALLIRDLQEWFPEWRRRHSKKWIFMCASSCVRLRISLSPMLLKHAASVPAGPQREPLSRRPFVEQILVGLQFQRGAHMGVHPINQELLPFVSLAGGPARVTISAVKRRMAEAQASLPLSHQALAAEHSGFLLEHFSRHSPLDPQDDCLLTCVAGELDKGVLGANKID